MRKALALLLVIGGCNSHSSGPVGIKKEFVTAVQKKPADAAEVTPLFEKCFVKGMAVDELDDVFKTASVEKFNGKTQYVWTAKHARPRSADSAWVCISWWSAVIRQK